MRYFRKLLQRVRHFFLAAWRGYQEMERRGREAARAEQQEAERRRSVYRQFEIYAYKSSHLAQYYLFSLLSDTGHQPIIQYLKPAEVNETTTRLLIAYSLQVQSIPDEIERLERIYEIIEQLLQSSGTVPERPPVYLVK